MKSKQQKQIEAAKRTKKQIVKIATRLVATPAESKEAERLNTKLKRNETNFINTLKKVYPNIGYDTDEFTALVNNF